MLLLMAVIVMLIFMEMLAFAHIGVKIVDFIDRKCNYALSKDKLTMYLIAILAGLIYIAIMEFEFYLLYLKL